MEIRRARRAHDCGSSHVVQNSDSISRSETPQLRSAAAIGKVHRIPLVGLLCMSPKRVGELAVRLGGELASQPQPLLLTQTLQLREGVTMSRSNSNKYTLLTAPEVVCKIGGL